MVEGNEAKSVGQIRKERTNNKTNKHTKRLRKKRTGCSKNNQSFPFG